MTAIETLERAISKLEQLRDAVTSPYWIRDRAKVVAVEIDEGEYVAHYLVARDLAPNDANLIVTLSRTVEPMLEKLRLDLEFLQNGWPEGMTGVRQSLALARAILGETNDR